MSLTVDPGATTPVFQQICDQVVASVREGRLAAGARLPTVRQLASDLGVATNTVAKAYRQLESEGHVQTRGRHGTVVLPPPGSGAGGRALGTADAFVAEARRSGLSLEEAVGLLRSRW
ncbi:GntR family transcriptional regulator [Ornithinimicrobium sp. W1679]|uniref:GntR family transcriptional regulator n=1 Tax=unclassified Ornithinimicrobium TaxID=2615080 RepID=UPI003CEC38F5